MRCRFYIGLIMLMLLSSLTKAYATTYRDPFVKPGAGGIMTVDMAYGLNNYAISSLTLIGVLTESNVSMAIVRDPQQHVYRLKIGDYLGLERARVTQILAKEVWVEWRLKNNKQTQVLKIFQENNQL